MTTETLLPIAGFACDSDDPWEALTRWGVVRELDVNKAFCKCKLPDGWKKIPANELNCANLIDSRGLLRAKIYCNDNLEAYISAFKRFSLRPVEKKEKPYVYMYEHYQVFDRGLDRPVFIDNKVECIVIGETLGAIQNKNYYLFSGKELERTELQKDWVPLSLDEFTDWNKEGEALTFVRLVRELAAINCFTRLKTLPKDDSIWSETFDFPEIKLPDYEILIDRVFL